MATHSSVLAWRIPGTGEPGGLPSLGSHRVGHDWSDLAAAAAEAVLISGMVGSRDSYILVLNIMLQIKWLLVEHKYDKVPLYFLNWDKIYILKTTRHNCVIHCVVTNASTFIIPESSLMSLSNQSLPAIGNPSSNFYYHRLALLFLGLHVNGSLQYVFSCA